MPRSLTPAALRALSRVARHGLYLWSPGSVAVLDDPWRSAVHVGSVGGLVARGFIAPRGEFEASVTAEGLAALRQAAGGRGTANAVIANTAIAVTVDGMAEDSIGQRIATTIVDAFRLAAAADAGSWEKVVDLAFAGRDNPVVGSLLVAALADAAGTQDAHVDVDFIAVGRRPI